jgi:hypothetical protein
VDVSVETLCDEYKSHNVSGKKKERECQDDNMGWASLKAFNEMVKA